MASSYTLNKNIEKPAYNDYAANPTGWSGPVNDDWDAIDTAFGGGLSLNATGSVGTVNLTITQTRNLIITITGAMTGNAIYTLPANTAATAIVGGQWIVYNNTTGNYTVTFSPVSGGGNSVVCTQGVRSSIYSDGTNVALSDDRVTPATNPIPSGTKMLFQQTAAPTGWTKDTTHNNKALRVVSGTAGSGGTVAFTTAFASQAVSGTVGNTTLTVDQIPLHGHAYRSGNGTPSSANGTGGFVRDSSNATTYSAFTGTPSGTNGEQIGGTGGGNSHTHTFTGTAIDLAVQYVDLIIATKD